MDEAVTELDFRRLDRSVVGLDRFVGAMQGGTRGFGVGFPRVVVGAQLFILPFRANAWLDECALSFSLPAAPVRLCQLAREVCFALLLPRRVFQEVRLRL